jgi:peptidyl-prolyl cis-trans isomerase A (cyclophilin A)
MKTPVLWLSLCLLSGLARPAAAQTPAATPKPPAPAANHPKITAMTTDPALLHPATLKMKAPDTFEVTFSTTKGDFVVQVTRAWAPIGVDRFYGLVKHGYFTGCPFFRIVPGFIVQFGLTGNPAVNKAWRDADIKDDPVTQSNTPGTLTFATAGPNTRTTQLFINLGSNGPLDRQGFAPFGKVTSGMPVVEALYAGYGEAPDQNEITTKGKDYFTKFFPKLDVINSATVTSSAAPAASATPHPAPSGGTPKP